MNRNTILIIVSNLFIVLAWGIAIAGVLRGYSIQPSWMLPCVLSASFILITIRVFVVQKADSIFRIGTLVAFSLAVVLFVVTLVQFLFVNRGDRLYEEGFYNQALRQYQIVHENRYLQFYDTNVFGSIIGAAKCHGQHADFEESRKLYLLADRRYTGGTPKRIAENYLRAFDSGLEIVSNFESVRDVNTLLEIARAYRYKIFCDKKAIETYKKVIEVTDSERFKSFAKEQIEALTGHIDEP